MNPTKKQALSNSHSWTSLEATRSVSWWSVCQNLDVSGFCQDICHVYSTCDIHQRYTIFKVFRCHWPSLSITRSCIKKRICWFTEQMQVIPKMCCDSEGSFCFVKSKFLFRQTSKTVSTVSHIAVLQNKMNISRSLKCVNVLKVLRRLFQNWNLTKKRPKMKLSAHKWGGVFVVGS